MTPILKGRRATRYLGLGRARLAALRLLSLPFLTSAVKVPAGKIIAQLLGPTNDRLIIEVRDPYLVHTVRQLKGTVATAQNLYGGASGEPYLPDARTLTPAAVASEVFDALTVAVGSGMTLRSMALPPAIFINNRIIAGGKDTEYTVDVFFLRGSYRRGTENFYPTQYRCAASSLFNAVGTPLVDIVPIGESAKGVPHAYAALLIEASIDVGYHYFNHVLLHFADVAGMGAPVPVWPPAALNTSRPELSSMAWMPCAYARGNVAFIQVYGSDKTNAWPVGVRQPDLILLTGFGAGYTSTPLMTACPDLNQPAYKLPTVAGQPDVLRLQREGGIASTGVGRMTFVCQAGTQRDTLIFTTADAGATWQRVAWSPPARETVYRPVESRAGLLPPNPAQETNNAAFQMVYSLQIGHVEFTTQNWDTNLLTRWISLDHGSTWSGTALTAATRFEHGTRGPAFAAPLVFDAAGNATLLAKINTDDLTKIRVDLYAGLATTKKFSVAVQPADYTGATYASLPKMCFFGSKEFAAPIKVGHPKFLEYPA